MWTVPIRSTCLKLEIDFLVGKKQLGKIIDRCIKVHGTAKTSEVLDASRRRAINIPPSGGITVAVCDATIPPEKKEIIAEAEEQIDKVGRLFHRGLISNEERYRGSLIENLGGYHRTKVSKALQTT